MPNNVVKSYKDEYKWERAEHIAAKAGRKGDYAYIMGIYKKMKPDHQFNKAASERKWVCIAGDIIAHAGWDSEKVASAFNAELELIELEKEAAMTARAAKKILKASMQKGNKVSPTLVAEAERIAISRGGRRGDKWLPKGWQAHAAKTRPVPVNPNAGKKTLAERGWDIPTNKGKTPKPKPKSLAERGYDIPKDRTPKTNVFEAAPGGKRVDVPRPAPRVEKVIKTPPKAKRPVISPEEQTRRQAAQAKAQADAAAEVAKKAPKSSPTVNGPMDYSRVRGRPQTVPSYADYVQRSQKTGTKPISEKAYSRAVSNSRSAPLTPQTPTATVGKVVPQAAPKKEVSQVAADSFKQEARGLAQGRYSTRLRSRASNVAAERRGLATAEKALAARKAEAKSAPSLFSGQSLAKEEAAVASRKVRLSSAKSSMKMQAKADRGTVLNQRSAKSRKAQGAHDTLSAREKERLSSLVRSGKMSANDAERVFQRKTVGSQRRLDRTKPSTPTPAPVKPQQPVNQPTSQVPPPQPKAPAPSQPTNQPQMSPSQGGPQPTTGPSPDPSRRLVPDPTPVQQAAAQSPGFWQQAKGAWGGMSQGQQLFTVGAGGVAAGAAAGVAGSSRQQPRPPMYGPAPQYQPNPQPVYR